MQRSHGERIYRLRNVVKVLRPMPGYILMGDSLKLFQQVLHRIRIVIFAVAVSSTGCAHKANTNLANIPSDLSRIGQFFTPESECGVVLRKSGTGRIFAIRTPIDRAEYLEKRWEIGQFETAIRKRAVLLQEDEDGKIHNVNVSHEDNFQYFNSLPTSRSWNKLKPFIQHDDEIWTFQGLDSGFVILRKGHLFCLVWTDHSL